MAVGSKLIAALLSLGLAVAAALAGRPAAEEAATPPPPAATEVDGRAAKASTQFSLDLLRHVYEGENTFLSPTSAALVLALTANGARGATQQAMLDTLRYPAMSMDEVNAAHGALRSIMTNPDPKVQVALANGVWHAKSLTPARAFVEQAQTHYGAQVRPVAFGSPDATQAINDWVKEQTRSRIAKLFEQLSPDTQMVLVNAIWFKGAWTEPFDPARTREHPFIRLDGTVKQVPLMHQSGRMDYLAEDGLQAIALPYGEGKRLKLYVLMPDRWEGFLEGLTAERWEAILGGLKMQQGTVGLPKVKLTYQAELLPALTEMGMGPAVGPGADFSGLFEGGVGPAIGRVVQKSFLEMNEEGTEAAAATGVVAVTSAPADPPFAMIIDRPYLVAIRDDVTGVVLFMGAIVDP